MQLNRTFVILNQYPVWHAVVNDNLPIASLYSSISKGNTFDDSSLAQERGLLLFLQGKEEEAIQVWWEAELVPSEVTAFQGRYAWSLNHYEEALAWYEHAVNLDPTQVSSWLALAELNQQLGNVAAAKLSYEQAFALGSASSVDPLAKLWRSDGNHTKAIDIWQSALDIFPNDPERLRWWRGLSNSLRAIEKWEEALKMTQLAINEFPNDPRLRVERGFALYYANGTISNARAEIEQAISMDENMALAYAALGEILAEEGNYEESNYWYSQAINLDAGNLAWHVARADNAFSEGDLPQALDYFDETVYLFPRASYPYYRMALIYRQFEQPEQAVESIERAIILLEQPTPQYFLRAANIYEWVGDNEKAIKAYQQVLEIDPNNETAEERIEGLID